MIAEILTCRQGKPSNIPWGFRGPRKP